MAFKKRDWLFVALVVIVVGVFIAISGEEKTSKVPNDETHKGFAAMAQAEGKKATEKFCRECHDTDENPLPEGHPPPFRCLFCHKFE